MMGMLATLIVVDTLLTALAFSMCSKKELHVHFYTVIVYSRKSLTQMKRRLSVSSENNLPTFRLNAPVIIRVKVKQCEQTLLYSHRPHPLMRRNGLVNQVKFLGLAHTLVTM